MRSDFREASFEHPLVAVDIVVLAVRGGALSAVLVRRARTPFQGKWAIPGGFIRREESLEAAALRELHEETGLRVPSAYLEQLYTFGDVRRDPRGRVLSVTHLVLVSGDLPEPRGGSDAAEARWFPMDRLPTLAFDHARILAYALRRLRYKLEYTNVAYALLPERFTLSELQAAYEAVFGRALDRRNFRKKIAALGFITRVRGQRSVGRGRPAQLWRFTKREPVNVKTFVAKA